MFDFTQVSNFLSELFGDNVRFQECLILHRSQTGKRRIFFARQVWRCLILHRSQTSQLTSLQQMSFCWYVVLHRAQMNGLNGDNKVNDFTQVSNSASARSGAGFRGVRFYISLKPLESLNNHKVGRPDIHIGFKQRIPILHHSGKVQKKVILHRSQTRSNSRVSTFVLEVFDFTQVSNKTSVNREFVYGSEVFNFT